MSMARILYFYHPPWLLLLSSSFLSASCSIYLACGSDICIPFDLPCTHQPNARGTRSPPIVLHSHTQATGNDAALSAREAQASNLNHKSAGHTNPSTNNQGSNRSPDHGSPTDAGGGGGSCEMGSDGSNSCGNGSCRRHHEGRNTKQGDVGGSGHAGSQNHHRGGIIEHKGTTGHRGQQTEAAASVRDSNGSGEFFSGLQDHRQLTTRN